MDKKQSLKLLGEFIKHCIVKERLWTGLCEDLANYYKGKKEAYMLSASIIYHSK